MQTGGKEFRRRDDFLTRPDDRYGVFVRDIFHDKTVPEEVKDCVERYHAARSLWHKLADDLAEFMGLYAVDAPMWRAGMRAERERSACHQHVVEEGEFVLREGSFLSQRHGTKTDPPNTAFNRVHVNPPVDAIGRQ